MLAAQVHLDAGLPWIARSFLNAVSTPSPDAQKTKVALDRVFRILNDDSPHVPCKARDGDGRDLCEKLRHLLAIPPRRAGSFSAFDEHQVEGRHTYPIQLDVIKKPNDPGESDNADPDALDILKIDGTPLLEFITKKAVNANTHKVTAEPLERHAAAGAVKDALDVLANGDKPERRQVLVRALRADRFWLSKLSFDSLVPVAKAPASPVEVVEVRNTPEYQLVVIRTLSRRACASS